MSFQGFLISPHFWIEGGQILVSGDTVCPRVAPGLYLAGLAALT